MRTSSLKTSRLILISISVLDLLFIGMIVLIIGWWIMTLFACWKGMLGIHPGLRCQQSKGHIVTRTTTKKWLFLNGILIKKDIDMSWRGIPLWNTPFISTTSHTIYPSEHYWRHIKQIIQLILRSIPFWNTSFVVLMQNVCGGAFLKTKWLFHGMGVVVLFTFIVRSQNILYFKPQLIERHLTISIYIFHFRFKKSRKSCRR